MQVQRDVNMCIYKTEVTKLFIIQVNNGYPSVVVPGSLPNLWLFYPLTCQWVWLGNRLLQAFVWHKKSFPLLLVELLQLWLRFYLTLVSWNLANGDSWCGKVV